MAITVERLEAEVDVDAAKAGAELKALDKEITKVARDRRANITFDIDKRGILRARNMETGKYVALSRDADTATNSLTHSLGKLNTVAQSGGSLLTLLKIPALVTAIPPAVGGINALGGAVVALSGAIGPLAGYMGILPGAIAGLGTAAASVVLPLKNAGEALKTLDAAKTTEEFEKGMRRLSGPTQDYVKLIRDDLRPAIKSLGDGASGGFLPGLNKGIKSALPLFGDLRSVLTSTGRVVGDVAQKFGAFFGSDAFRSDLGKISQSNARGLRSLGDAALSAVKALSNIAVAARPLTEAFANSIEKAADSFNRLTKEGRDSGRLTDFFQRANQVGHQLYNTFKDLGAALVNLGKAASQGLGRSLLDSFERGAQALRDMTEESSNVAAMTAYFQDMRAPLQAAGRLVKDLVRGWIALGNNDQLTALLDQIRTELVPNLLKLANSAHEAFGPAIVSLLSEFATAFGTLMGTTGALTGFVQGLTALVNGFNRLAEAAPWLADVIGLVGILKISLFGLRLASHATGFGLLAGKIGTMAEVMRAGGTASQGFKSALLGVNAAVVSVGAALTIGVAAFLKYRAAQEAAAQAARTLRAETNAQATEITSLKGVENALQATADARHANSAAIDEFNSHHKVWKAMHAEEGAILSAESQALNDRAGELRRLSIASKEIAAATGASTDSIVAFVAEMRAQNVVFYDTLTLQQAFIRNQYEIARANNAAAQSSFKAAWEGQASALRDLFTANESVTDAQRAYAEVVRQSVVDTRSLTRAQKELAAAQADIDDQRYEAAEDLEDLRFAQRRAVIAEARAVEALQDQYKDLAADQMNAMQEASKITDDFTGKIYEVTRITGKEIKAQDKKSASLLDQAEAQLAVEEAKDATADATKALVEAEKKGVEQSDRVVAAKQRIVDAQEAVRDAYKAISEQVRANEEATLAASRRVKDAIEGQKDAQQKYKEQVVAGMVAAVTASVAAQREREAEKAAIKSTIEQVKNLATEYLKTALAIAAVQAVLFPNDDKASAKFTFLDQMLKAEAKRAGGGDFQAGRDYIVGEHGPERLRMNAQGTAGSILPAGPTAALLGASSGVSGGSKDGLSREEIRVLVEEIARKMQKPDIKQEFYGDDVDPAKMGAQLAWELRR